MNKVLPTYHTVIENIPGPYTFYDKVKHVWNTILPSCEDIVYNTWYKFAIKKFCCSETTQYPVRSLGCKDIMEDLDGMLLKNSSSNSIYYACNWTEGVVPIFPSIKSYTYQHVSLLFSNVPISCTIHGITVLSWNLSGLCNHEKRPNATTFTTTSGTTSSITTVSQQQLPVQNEMKPVAIQFIQEQLQKKVKVICLQELFLPDRSTHTDGNQLLKEFCGKYKDYACYYDNFIGGMIIHNSLIEKPKPTLKGGRKRKLTRRYRKGGATKLLPFPPNQDNKLSIIKIYVHQQPLYIVNVCLSPLYHSAKQYVHENEMRYVMAHLSLLKAFSDGVLFIGDHKHNTIDFYKTIRPESSMRR
jgi:hypothetical protein